MRIIYVYQNTKSNNEDIALTPYLFGVYVNEKIIKVLGIGICWIYWSFSVNIGFGIPKNYKKILFSKK